MIHLSIPYLSLGLLLCLWAGTVFGVSFLATPAKFRAPSLTLPAALDVGRHTFRMLERVEVAATVLCFSLCLVAQPGRVVWVCVALAGVLLAVQILWLLPMLDTRVELILEGGEPAASRHHVLFVAMETVKVLLLLFGSLTAIAGSGSESG